MDRQRKADMMLVLATGFWGVSNCLTAICLRELQPLTLNAFRFLTAFLVLGLAFRKRIARASRETLKYSLLVGLSRDGLRRRCSSAFSARASASSSRALSSSSPPRATRG